MPGLKEAYSGHREAVLYIACGAVTTLVTWLSYAVFVWMGAELNVANIASWVCGVLFAFASNKWIVFMSKSLAPSRLLRELGSFFFARIATGLVAFALFPILLGVGVDQSITGTAGDVAKGITSVMEIALNYVLSKYIVFRHARTADG